MKKEQAVRREEIREAWFDFPVSTCELCEPYLDEFPDDGFIWALYGEALTRLARFADARRALDTANGFLVNDGGKTLVYGYRGHLFSKLGDYAAAEHWYRHAAALEPTSGAWQLYLGGVLRHQQRDHEAEACYRKALLLDGERDEYLLNLGYVLQARGDLDGAAQCYREALAIDPEYAEAKESLEDVLKALDLRRRRDRV
jgi:tetratricopeptide (TPR) repeat protein